MTWWSSWLLGILGAFGWYRHFRRHWNPEDSTSKFKRQSICRLRPLMEGFKRKRKSSISDWRKVQHGCKMCLEGFTTESSGARMWRAKPNRHYSRESSCLERRHGPSPTGQWTDYQDTQDTRRYYAEQRWIYGTVKKITLGWDDHIRDGEWENLYLFKWGCTILDKFAGSYHN